MYKHIEQAEIDRKRKERREKARQTLSDIEIDMNPMVDLAFLLLTFFMLTTTFNQPLVMDIVTPVKPKGDDVINEQPVRESKTLTILLGPENRIFWFMGITDPDIQETDYSAEGIREVVSQKQTEIEGLVILIKGSEEADYQDLVNILDEMKLLKAERYAVVDIGEADVALMDELI
jgi:biopolymer transport protein ExbD